MFEYIVKVHKVLFQESLKSSKVYWVFCSMLITFLDCTSSTGFVHKCIQGAKKLLNKCFINITCKFYIERDCDDQCKLTLSPYNFFKI